MSPTEMTIIDPGVVKAEVVEYIGSVVEDARVLAVAIADDESCEKAIALGATVKDKIKWLKGRRLAIYKPLADATENVRLEYDTPLKLGEQIEKTLAAAVITYKQKKRAEEEKRRLEAEAEARRIREDAARKEREAAAERERIIREREVAEQRKRDEAATEERRKREAIEAEKRAAEAKAKAEADERARQLKEEEERRLASAQKAHDVGLAERSEQILEKQLPVAPLPAPLPSAADIEAQARVDQARRDEEAARAREADERRVAEEAKRGEEAAHLKRLDDEAALAKAAAAEAEAAASQQMVVNRPDDRMRTDVRWKYDVPTEADFRKLCLAIGQNRAPVEYGGYDPEQPQKFRGTALLQKDVTRLKQEFNGADFGIRTWPEEGGSFKGE